MVEKKLGAMMTCQNCGTLLTCNQIEYMGETKLQWQNPDKSAHYKFITDGKFECNIPDELEDTIQKSLDVAERTVTKEPSLTGLALTDEEMSILSRVIDEAASRVIYTYIKVRQKCHMHNITEPAVIGMIFNKTRETMT